MGIRVLINAGPWLPVPPTGYGGIENMVATLIPELRRRGVRVVLASVGESRLPVDELVSVFQRPQFAVLQRPYNRVMGVANAHMHLVARHLREHDDIDLVHDHMEAIGPTVLSAMDGHAPPVLHTLHWDLGKHPELYGGFDSGGVSVNGVSAAQLARAPAALRAHSLGHVHLSTPLARYAHRRITPSKVDYLVVLGRITPGKGQHIAARLAHRLSVDVVLAGPVGPHHDPRELARALAEQPDAAQNPDVAYWCEQVRPHVDGCRVRWIGSVTSAERDQLVAHALATLFPLCWEEPGGTAVVESLALGTPVLGYARGCLPELVEHGHTGLLAAPDDEDGLAALVSRVRALNPADCRHAAARRFSPSVMADGYCRLYEQVLSGR